MDVRHRAARLTVISRVVAGALAASLPACHAEAQNSRSPQKDRTMSENQTPAPTDAPPPFTFTLRSVTDPSPVPEGGQYATVLRVDGASRSAIMTINRWGGDTSHPIGLFHDVLPQSDAGSLSKAVTSTRWSELPRPTGGVSGGASLTLEYVEGPRIIRRAFSATNFEFLHAIAPIMSNVDQLQARLLEKPARAIRIGVAYTGSKFKITWQKTPHPSTTSLPF